MNIRVWRFVLGGFALLLVGLIIWIDITTDVWQKYVVMSGLAGGVVTFVFTALIVDRLIARAAHERWEPVTRLALGDLRRGLSDPRSRTEVRGLPGPRDVTGLPALVEAAERERDRLVGSLARWSSFLASSADVADIMDAVATLAMHLDDVDDAARALISSESPEDWRALRVSLDEYDRAGAALLAHIDAALVVHGGRELRLTAGRDRS